MRGSRRPLALNCKPYPKILRVYTITGIAEATASLGILEGY
jgi:hypothetical protein